MLFTTLFAFAFAVAFVCLDPRDGKCPCVTDINLVIPAAFRAATRTMALPVDTRSIPEPRSSSPALELPFDGADSGLEGGVNVGSTLCPLHEFLGTIFNS